MLLLYILLSLIYISYSIIETDNKLQEFINYTKKYNKVYPTKEEFYHRFNIWKENYKKIQSSNQTPKLSPFSTRRSPFSITPPIPTSHFSINKFADLTQEEFSSKYLTFNAKNIQNLPTRSSKDLGLDDIKAPENFDWEYDRGIKTKTKAQHSCSACYAFAAVGAVQSQYLIKYGKNVSFSEQQIIDCDELNYHCDGGNMKKAFTYLQNEGLMAEEDYPYISEAGECKYNENKALVKVKQFNFVPKNEEEMKKALYKYGPLAGAINGALTAFYSGGIYDPVIDEICPNIINHAVLIVGYGVDKFTGTKFWRIKNSWGTDWGEGGFGGSLLLNHLDWVIDAMDGWLLKGFDLSCPWKRGWFLNVGILIIKDSRKDIIACHIKESGKTIRFDPTVGGLSFGVGSRSHDKRSILERNIN